MAINWATTEGSVVFGIQYLIKKYLIDEFN